MCFDTFVIFCLYTVRIENYCCFQLHILFQFPVSIALLHFIQGETFPWQFLICVFSKELPWQGFLPNQDLSLIRIELDIPGLYAIISLLAPLRRET